MMNKTFIVTIALLVLALSSCKKDGQFSKVEIPEFNFPETVVFEENLSSYSIYDGLPSDLVPSSDFHLVELSSVLFTDYSHKQRLVKVPVGTQMIKLADGSLEYPDGTILVKTFYYYHEESDPSQGKRIIESRLLIKESGIWNAATYVWNEAQTDAYLTIDGLDTQVSWTNANGIDQSTLYHVPTSNECMTCHQSNSTVRPLGPTLRNLNRTVERNGFSQNQIEHLQSLGILNVFSVNEVSNIVDYNNVGNSISNRGRAYLDMNCAHCHNPNAWDIPAKVGLDLRYETPLNETGIQYESERISNSVLDGEMPFIGTTMRDDEGVSLVLQYLETL